MLCYEQAVDTAVRVLKEGGMDAIKLEGRAPSRITAAKAIVVETAMALQEAGCFSVDLECVPAPVAAATTSALRIPTIGIGAGPFCSGQALVYHDLLGMMQHPHHAKVTPKFCKQFGQVEIPYKIGAADMDGFLNALQKLGFNDAASAAAAAAAEKIQTS
ncbi:hypothetical protein KY290_008636 [Solanum tuberosum]|uniref:3-methyl-2-oxobutanoate hydroxymethyltransferase n=1 Tax=Solanum tuberosum TaxID=4113 RepID=A0ABQ7WB54_SOLTU|nr:hypothetical protein KY290_008636 [Solanum tuberosum]